MRRDRLQNYWKANSYCTVVSKIPIMTRQTNIYLFKTIISESELRCILVQVANIPEINQGFLVPGHALASREILGMAVPQPW